MARAGITNCATAKADARNESQYLLEHWMRMVCTYGGLSHLMRIGAVAFAVSAIARARSSIAATTNTAQRPSRFVLIGDSTVCEYSRRQTTRGWGQFIQERFRDGTVKVVNLAAAGCSTKTFIQEGRWRKALREKPDYVLIQFGHNDSHAPGKPESTQAAGNYKDYLRRYIDESRAIGAIPVLVTPMVRRTFDVRGKIEEGSGINDLVPYVNAMKEISQEKHMPVIDLYTSSKALAETLGPEASATMANRKGDLTHFNERGARAMAELVIQELPTAVPELAKQLKSR
jgi:lysophospholipase L1-like esterase